MDALVDGQGTSDRERFPATRVITDVRSFVSVASQMLLQRCRLGEILITVVAFKRAMTRMRL